MAESPEIVKVKITVGTDGDYYVSAFSRNGNEIFRSSEGYRLHQDALGAAQSSWPNAEYEDEVAQ